MGRIDILERFHPSVGTGPTRILAGLAQNELREGRSKQAAELLRAAEHWTFATLASAYAEVSPVGPELTAAIAEQFEDLLRRAEEHWEEEPSSSEALKTIYETARKSAAQAHKSANYFQALEFARAAEALAHARNHGPLKLKPGQSIPRTDWKLAG